MRPAERRRDVAHGDGMGQSVLHPLLQLREPPPAGLPCQRHLRPGERRFLRRPFRVEVRFPRLIDRLEHRQRIERVDRQ
jgi:hypothetical protein